MYDPQTFTIEELLNLPLLPARTTFNQAQTDPIEIDFEATDSDPTLHTFHPSPTPSLTSPPPQPNPEPPLLLPSQPTPSQPRRTKKMAVKPKCTFTKISPDSSQTSKPSQSTQPPTQITQPAPHSPLNPTVFEALLDTTTTLPPFFARKRNKTPTP
ncbi:hypothetical protein ACLOJK_014650 [Asimina triloba]